MLTWCVGMTNATGHRVERYIAALLVGRGLLDPEVGMAVGNDSDIVAALQILGGSRGGNTGWTQVPLT